MKEDGSVNLSQGIVAQLLGKSGKVNGGSVSWNMEDHSLTYVDGTLLARHNVYVLADGTISLSVTLADDVLPHSAIFIGNFVISDFNRFAMASIIRSLA